MFADKDVSQRVCDWNSGKSTANEVCAVNVDNWGPCTRSNGYGYKNNSPCVFIKLNRVNISLASIWATNQNELYFFFERWHFPPLVFHPLSSSRVDTGIQGWNRRGTKFYNSKKINLNGDAFPVSKHPSMRDEIERPTNLISYIFSISKTVFEIFRKKLFLNKLCQVLRFP